MAHKKCPAIIDRYLLHDPLIIEDGSKGRVMDGALEGIINEGYHNKPVDELRSLSVNNYFPNEGEYGGCGCMI